MWSIRSRRDTGVPVDARTGIGTTLRLGLTLITTLALAGATVVPASAAADVAPAVASSPLASSALPVASAGTDLVSDDPDVVSAANGAQLGTSPTADSAARLDPPESSYGEVVTVTVTGRFVLPSGKAAAGVRLAAEASYGDGGNGVLASMTTGADGAFTLNVQTARPFKLGVTPAEGLVSGSIRDDGTLRPGNAWSEGIWVLQPVAGTSALGNVKLLAGHVVSGSVTVSGPLSATEARLDVWSETARFEAPVTVKTGVTPWKITLPSGSYRASVTEYGAGISAYHGGSSEETAAAFPVNGAVTGIGISATVSGRTISGTVRDSAGRPVADASVGISARPWSTDPGRFTMTGSDGTYTLVNIQPGTYELTFSASGPTVYWPGTDDPDAAELVTVTSETSTLTGYDVTVSAGVRISGTSTNPDGSPRQGDQVRFVKNGREVGSDTTRADGTYRSWGLPAGEYVVSLVQGGFQGGPQGGLEGGLEQWYDGKRSAAEANLVDASEEGKEYSDIDFVAVTGGTVKGAIRFAGGSPVVGAAVSVFAAQNLDSPVGATQTDANGRYSVSGLKVDNYVVKVSSGSSGVVDAWFGATKADPNPQVIELGIDGSFTADIETHPGGTVRGTVRPSAPGQPVFLTLMRTDAPGYRSLTLPAGDGGPIDWEVSGLEGTWAASIDGRYWPNLTAMPEEASLIEITAGQVTSGIDFDLGAGVNLFATFSTSDGSSIAYMSVIIERERDGFWEHVTQLGRDTAQFAFALTPGSYRLRASGNSPSGDALRDTQTAFTISAGQPTELAITTASGWVINGRVTDAATGAPVSGIDLAATSATGSGYAMSRSDGTYRLVVGATGRWSIRGAGVSDLYAPSTREVAVVDGVVEGADVALSRGHRLSGRVTAENNGNPLSNVAVEVQDASGDRVAWLITQSDGTYRTPALPAGAYGVRFFNWNGLYIEEWWDGAADRASADDVIVSGKPVAGVDASMRLGGVVAGTVRDADGAPVPGATVGLATPPPSGIDAFFAPLGKLFGGGADPILGIETITDADGDYRLPPAESGSYALYVHTPTAGTTWYDGRSTLSSAQTIAVASGSTVSVPLALRKPTAGDEPRTPVQSLSDDFAIQRQPRNTTVAVGEQATFTAAASGLPVPSIRWEKRAPGVQKFTAVAGETTSTLSMEPALAASGTEVRAVFTQAGQTLTSDVAKLTVTAPPTVPAAPAKPSVTAVSSASAEVSWTAPTTGGSVITGYTVRVLDGTSVIRELGVSGKTLTITGLTASKAYGVTVSANNVVGAGAESPKASFTTKAPATVPSAPTGVSAVAGNGQAVVSWTAPSSDGGAPVTGYTVTARPGGIVVSTGGETTATVTGLTNGTAYFFAVKAQNSVGASVKSGLSESVTPMAPVVAPSAPTGVSAVAGDGQAVVSWSAPPSDGGAPVTEYTVTAQPGGIAVSTTGDRTATVPGLTNGTAYTFAVTARNSAGVSPASTPSGAVTPTATAAADAVTRQSGANRFDTAVDVSKKTYPSAGVPVVYLANGYGFPDALAGAAAAGHFGGPVLLTEQNVLPAVVAAELVRLKPQRMVILGGTGTVSASLEALVKKYTAGEVARQSGPTRFDTAVDVSKKTFPSGGVPVLYLANGYGFPDALAGAAAAGHFGGPVLLTEQNTVPAAVAAEIQRLKPTRIVILGGTGSVSAAVQSQVVTYTSVGWSGVTRQEGPTRFETAVAVSKATFAEPGVPVVYLANGYGFPDALTGAAAAGHLGGPVLLTEQNALPAAVAAELDRLNPQRIVILGGTGTVSASLEKLVRKYIGG